MSKLYPAVHNASWLSVHAEELYQEHGPDGAREVIQQAIRDTIAKCAAVCLNAGHVTVASTVRKLGEP